MHFLVIAGSLLAWIIVIVVFISAALALGMRRMGAAVKPADSVKAAVMGLFAMVVVAWMPVFGWLLAIFVWILVVRFVSGLNFVESSMSFLFAGGVILVLLIPAARAIIYSLLKGKMNLLPGGVSMKGYGLWSLGVITFCLISFSLLFDSLNKPLGAAKILGMGFFFMALAMGLDVFKYIQGMLAQFHLGYVESVKAAKNEVWQPLQGFLCMLGIGYLLTGSSIRVLREHRLNLVRAGFIAWWAAVTSLPGIENTAFPAGVLSHVTWLAPASLSVLFALGLLRVLSGWKRAG